MEEGKSEYDCINNALWDYNKKTSSEYRIYSDEIQEDTARLTDRENINFYSQVYIETLYQKLKGIGCGREGDILYTKGFKTFDDQTRIDVETDREYDLMQFYLCNGEEKERICYIAPIQDRILVEIEIQTGVEKFGLTTATKAKMEILKLFGTKTFSEIIKHRADNPQEIPKDELTEYQILDFTIDNTRKADEIISDAKRKE